MQSNGVAGVGISAHKRANDLSDFGAELDMIEALGVDAVELPLYDMDVVVGGRIRRPQMDALRRAVAGRSTMFSVHGPLAVNLMQESWRLPRHMEVLAASLEATAEVGAVNYVIHSGHAPVQQGDGLEDAYARQRDALSRAGDMAREHGIVLCVETLFAEFDGRIHATSPRRLAAEIDAVAHPNVMATVDFSHSYIKLDWDGLRDTFVEEIAALAPCARHLHVHDSFGRQDDIWMYTEGERIAYGHGDLHLPVGWGDIPFDVLMETSTFAHGVIFNIELNQRHWHAAAETVAATRRLASRARTAQRVVAAE